MEEKTQVDMREAGASGPTAGVTRRVFLRNGVAAAGIVSAGSGMADAQASASPRRSSFVDLLRVPDRVTAFGGFEKTLPVDELPLARKGEEWTGGQVVVESKVERDGLALTLASSATPISLLHVRWNAAMDAGLQILGDAWERSYGELGWRNLQPERVMAWYFATYDGESCHGYGVKTDAGALCFWQVDSEGVSLWLNVMNGGSGVVLRGRRLTAATVGARERDSVRLG